MTSEFGIESIYQNEYIEVQKTSEPDQLSILCKI